jgi:hypothetical protein
MREQAIRHLWQAVHSARDQDGSRTAFKHLCRAGQAQGPNVRELTPVTFVGKGLRRTAGRKPRKDKGEMRTSRCEKGPAGPPFADRCGVGLRLASHPLAIASQP